MTNEEQCRAATSLSRSCRIAMSCFRKARALADVRDWVSKNVDFSIDDRRMVKMQSGEELRLFERMVSNLLTPRRPDNLTARGYVEHQARDTYAVTATDKEFPIAEYVAIAELETLLEDVVFGD